MNNLDLKRILLGSTLLVSSAFAVATTASAQELIEGCVVTDDNDCLAAVETATTPVVEEVNDGTEVIVTGSRLRKSTFNSITPLQVIDTDVASEEGLFNPVEILQSSSAAGGLQIDSTFQGFVLDNGPGSETIDLRGLGADRTLVLLNGRRVSPAGVEGAPAQVSINLIPRTMVDQYDLLLDGASSVYGSDAVAGVLNVILKNDFDGLELEAQADTPETGNGQDYTLSARYGKNGDRGFIGGAVEYTYQDPWTTNDRDFLAGCETYREITESGEIRTVDIQDQNIANQLGLNIETSECRPTRLTQRFIAGSFGSIYYQPGIGNTGISGFSESTLFGVPIDGDNDGNVDVAFHNFSPNGQQDDVRQLVNEQKQISLMAIGEYTFEGDANITPYFEALHVAREITAIGQQPQLFPFVSGNNPFNPCNTLAGGVDCNEAYNNVLRSPSYLANFANYYTNPALSGTDDCFGFIPAGFACTPQNFGLELGAAAQTTARPVIGVRGDRNVTDVTLDQTHLVGGVRGDLPFLNFGEFNDWTFEVAGTHSFADGNSSRTGIRGDRLNFALGNDIASGAPVGNTPCDPTIGADPQLLVGCVPVNLFAPSLYSTANAGEFATQAERDYLFDTRDFDTHTALTVVDASIQGDVVTLPGGDVSLLLGAQWRKDHLNSQPDSVASDGLFFGFFSDQGGAGDRTTKEIYGEAFIPLGLGKTGLRELNVELAGRLTDDEFYGTNETYSIKAGYRPIDALLVRGTYGTSFKAPNLRQLFLAGQTGFGTLADPCAVPDAAYNALTMTYDPTQDTRTQVTLDNCVAAGVDPTSFLAGQFSAYSVEIQSGGATDLDPETSTSYTLGFSFEQPFTDAFDLEFGATYYNIDIESTIIEPGAGFIIGDCYNQVANFGSAFCSRINRDFNDVNNPGIIDLVDAGFINRDQEVAKGVDYNVRFDKDDVALFGTSFDFFGRLQANNNHSRKRVDIINGVVAEDQLVKEFGFPKWRGRASLGFNVDRWSAAWTTRYQTEVTVDEEFIPTFGAGTTCLGAALGGVDCRPVFSAGDYWHHTVSAGYEADSWDILVGVSNVFKTDPPLVDPSQVFSVVNVPIGNGYDLNGREYFVQLRKRFN